MNEQRPTYPQMPTEEQLAFIQAYREKKLKVDRAVLLVRWGDFWEVFDDDARTLHELEGRPIREFPGGTRTASIPYHSLDEVIAKLEAAGFPVVTGTYVQASNRIFDEKL